MHLFLAVELPKEVKDYLFSLQKEVKEAKITWVPKKNLHLTLKFFGKVEEEQIEEIKKRMHINTKSFKVQLQDLGFFPSEKDPKVFWINLDPEEKIIQLQQKIDGEFLDFSASDQKFSAHITLGKIKSIRREKDFHKSVKGIQIKNIEFNIENITLFQSTLRRGAPQYGVLEHVVLS